jgi:hypothetical protein
MSSCVDLIDSADKAGTFLNRIITAGEMCCFLYDSQLKLQSATWKLPSSARKKLQQDRSEGKVMLELFLDPSGIVRTEFIPEGVTANKHRYKEPLCHLFNSVHCKCPRALVQEEMTALPHTALCLFKRSWQNSRSPFCHTLHTHLISHHVISFSFPV